NKNNVKRQDLPECSIPKARSEERGRPATAKDASKDEFRDYSQKRRALAKHAPSVPVKDVGMDEPENTSQPGRAPVKRAFHDPLEEDTPSTKKTIRLG
ncbi:hypothetical protein BGX30_009128, partial [Mortierella sp. GBA39]